MKRIVVGMSGGVDSSVSALLLKQQGYEVVGLFMQNWDSVVNNDLLGNPNLSKILNDGCDAEQEFEVAQKVADQIGIKLHKVNFIKEYWDSVFSVFLKEYKSGRTPNPDILCNKFIKFNAFAKYAFEELKADKIAMGHYAQVKEAKGKFELIRGKDNNKDQTYFLCQLSQEQLSKALFPVGNLEKDEVRKIAKEHGLINWDKKDSTGICFIGERDFDKFLENYLISKPGNIVDIKTNRVIGRHKGIFYYTIGQRKGIGTDGNESKYYVCDKSLEKNILYVCSEQDKGIFLVSKACIVKDFVWNNSIPQSQDKLTVKFRYRQEDVKCSFELINNDQTQLVLKYYQTESVTIGQYAVIYSGEVCLGGGIIDKIIRYE